MEGSAARQPEPGPHPVGVPEETTPTWEMELLISGATVFGLASLPGRLDGIFYDLYNRSSHAVAQIALPVWIYAKVALLMLIGTFALHLFLRGYWVSLVGLDSVYPGGIRWERLRLGAQQRAALESLGGMAERIEAADNRATRVFGVGFGLALVMVVPTLLSGLALGGALAGEALGHADLALQIVLGALFAFFVPAAALSLVDRAAGARLRHDGALARRMRGAFRFYAGLASGRGANPLIALFRAHEGAWRTGAVVTAVLLASSAVVLSQFAADAGKLDLGDFAGLPPDEPGEARNLLPQHYANLRGDPKTPVPHPFLPERVVRGRYLELFVPYQPRRHGPALRERCPAALAEAEAGSPAAALACLAGLIALQVDGAAVQVPLDAATDTPTGLRGVLAMIPAEGLAPGRHELAVAVPPASRGRDSRAARIERIAFWK